MKSLVLIALLAMLASCSSSAIEPKPDCEFPTAPSQGSLCVQAVKVNLGPADEVEGYDPISDLLILVLPYLGSISGDDGETPALEDLLAGGIQHLEEAATDRGLTNGKGSSFILTEPGDHVICAIGRSLADASRKVSHCEQAMLVSGEATPLVIRHSPWGDRLYFSWTGK